MAPFGTIGPSEYSLVYVVHRQYDCAKQRDRLATDLCHRYRDELPALAAVKLQMSSRRVDDEIDFEARDVCVIGKLRASIDSRG